MEKKGDKKPSVNLKIGRSAKKEKKCFRWELNSRPFIMTKVGNYIEDLPKKKKLFSLRVELKTFYNSRGG